jgi:hypothetical protein
MVWQLWQLLGAARLFDFCFNCIKTDVPFFPSSTFSLRGPLKLKLSGGLGKIKLKYWYWFSVEKNENIFLLILIFEDKICTSPTPQH